MSLTNSTGYTWNEAPEMLVVNGKYYLYSDPWNHGQDESTRDVYRAESDDLVTWTNMERCNADVTMRHYTPLYIGDLKIEDNTPNTPVTPPSNDKPTTPNEPDKQTTDLSIINLWDGDINSFYPTNRNNYVVVNNFITELNISDNSFLEPLTFK